jgi:hypothetical protein
MVSLPEMSTESPSVETVPTPVVAPFHLECPYNCSLREGTPHGAFVTERLVAKDSFRSIVTTLAAKKVKMSLGTISRHNKHIVLANTSPEDDEEAHVSSIVILDAIIQKAYQNKKNWKPTISDALKAMDMHFRLTNGSPFDELLNTLADASVEDENPAAISAPGELEDTIDSEG